MQNSLKTNRGMEEKVIFMDKWVTTLAISLSQKDTKLILTNVNLAMSLQA